MEDEMLYAPDTPERITRLAYTQSGLALNG